jgi:predicted Zn-dependent protease
LGRWPDAIDQLEALAALDPARPERLVDVGLAYAGSGRPNAAIATLGRAAERHPQAASVYTALGRVWLDAGEASGDGVALTKAVEALGPISRRSDANSETLALYGRALFLRGNAAAAERVLQQAVTRTPLFIPAYRFLAEAATRLGHVAMARDAAARYEALTGTS